ncbi:uncharacterized protein [Atheta coriaria]|uniref:uncharacterized protein isoform X3 n=1 Tax=Dalotia coriaria TaxID=877792 RepID=UPI0031F3EC99
MCCTAARVSFHKTIESAACFEVSWMQGAFTMDKLPILPFEIVLSYLNTLDKHNAIVAFNYDVTALGSTLNSKISLALEYRFRQNMINTLIGRRKALVKELDLTGIFWIPKHVILKACAQLVNLEYLYLLGTSVAVNTNFKDFQGMQKIKCVAVAVNDKDTITHSLLERRIIPYSDQICFDSIVKIKLPMYNHPIFIENWMALLKAGATMETIHRDMEKLYTTVTYSDFMVEDEKLKEYLYELRNVKILNVEQSTPPRIATVNLEPIKFLVNLTALYIDVHSAVGNMFLKPLLQSCRNLTKLNITCYNATFSFTHLKYASNSLRDLSVCMRSSVYFNMEKFFFDINQHSTLHLRRLYLRFNQMNDARPATHAEMLKFMRRQAQLIFVCIECTDVARKTIRDIGLLLRSFKKEPHQLFTCIHHTNLCINGIPLQHVDLVHNACRENRI